MLGTSYSRLGVNILVAWLQEKGFSMLVGDEMKIYRLDHTKSYCVVTPAGMEILRTIEEDEAKKLLKVGRYFLPKEPSEEDELNYQEAKYSHTEEAEEDEFPYFECCDVRGDFSSDD